MITNIMSEDQGESKDEKVDMSTLKPTENRMNRVSTSLIKMFGVGSEVTVSQSDRGTDRQMQHF